MDYHAVLEVSKNASKDEIEKAYRKLAVKYHPDRNPDDKDAVEKFKAVSEAYEILSGRKEQPQPRRQHHDIWDIFNQSFNVRPVKALPKLLIELQISFMEALKGCQKTATIYPSKYEVEKCSVCNGKGAKVVENGFWSSFDTCHACGGRGMSIKEDKNYKIEPTDLDIKLPAGCIITNHLILENHGHYFPENRGEVVVQLKVESHPFYFISNNYLCLKLPLTYSQLIKGGEFEIPTYKSKVNLKVPPGTNHNTKFRLAGQGIRGNDMYVVLNLLLPEIDKKILKKFEKIESSIGFTELEDYNKFVSCG